jgi:uncharacterized protein YndB with AHSA1/START domain
MKSLSLVARRVIPASAEVLFDAWTTPSMLLSWWGPRGVRCTHAEVDARVGGRYRLGNELPDGSTVWIGGEFVRVERPTRLEYTWVIGDAVVAEGEKETVTVRFEARGAEETEVIVVHERIADEAMRRGHAEGWEGCLEGLREWADGTVSERRSRE